MLNVSPSQLAHPGSPAAPGIAGILWAVLAFWFGAVVLLGAEGAFVTPPGSPPLPVLFGVALPLVLFLGGFRMSPSFREFVLNADLRLLTAIQAWRFAGFGFLALYAHAVLPGAFAWPAGLGDITIGISAPWLMIALARRSRFAASRFFIVWNLLGILDLVVAVGTGGLLSALAGAAGKISIQPMAELPLLLIPAFLVPVFGMLHVAALLQARRFAREPARS